MGQKEKLITKLKSNPKTFTFADAEHPAWLSIVLTK